MEKLSLQDIAEAVGSRIDDGLDTEILSVSTDTRKIEPGSLFIPIKGERFDGHDFIDKALQLGAAAALTERPDECGPRKIYVPDTRLAYLRLAGWYRRRFPVSVVGVTGSVGKTTTKEMIAAVLESKYRTLKTEGNHNNEIGLPATLLELDSSYQMAVIEMGMSHFREISRLSQCAAPNLGVITNIGVSHIENLGSREGILRAKLEILDGMERQAPLILNADNDLLGRAAEELDREVLCYGIESEIAEIRAVDIIEQKRSTEFDILYYGKRIHAKLPTVGRHNVYNALAAFGVGLSMDIPPEKMAAALEAYAPSGMRQRIVDSHGMTLIEDCYNASPDSMRAAIGVLAGMECAGRRIAVLADMLELGEIAGRAHREMGKLAAESGIDMLLCYGELSRELAETARANGLAQACHFRSKEELTKELLRQARSGDCILFKGSRGMRLEEVIEKLNRES